MGVMFTRVIARSPKVVYDFRERWKTGVFSLDSTLVLSRCSSGRGVCLVTSNREVTAPSKTVGRRCTSRGRLAAQDCPSG